MTSLVFVEPNDDLSLQALAFARTLGDVRPVSVEGPYAPAAWTCGATVRIRGSPCRRASSSRLPPQRIRVTTSPSIRITFAAKG